MKLRLSEDLALPVDAATQTFLVVGKRGSGKSNTAARIAEQLLKAKVPIVVFDPVDAWYGLKASRDGTGQGYGVYVFGGRHKDVDLKPEAGALIAEFLCEHRAPLVLSCKHLSGLERSRFMVDFAMTLYRKWTGGVLHLILEEAHELAPQNPPKGEKAEEMLGAFKKLWKLGRSSGIGGTAVTQRPASLSKDVTTQSEILVVHRTIGPQDVEAVRQWIKYHRQGEEILSELATLKTGEAFVWGPEFPEEAPIGLRRVQILQRETFDSASTPKAGEQRTEPKDLAPVDLDRLKSKMAATMERAKSEDPRELQKTVRELRARLAEAEKAKPAATAVVQKIVEKPALSDAHVKRLEALGEKMLAEASRHGKAMAEFWANQDEVHTALLAALRAVTAPPPATPRPRPMLVAPPPLSRPAPSNGHASVPAEGLTGPEQRILDALAWLRGVGNDEPEEAAVAFLAGYTVGGGAFNNPRGRLNKRGLIAYKSGGRIALTDEGSRLAHLPDLDLNSEELQKKVLERLPGPERKLLVPLLQVYPDSMTIEALAAASNYEPGGGAFNNPKGRLRTLGLIDYPERGRVAAKSVLFVEGP